MRNVKTIEESMQSCINGDAPTCVGDIVAEGLGKLFCGALLGGLFGTLTGSEKVAGDVMNHVMGGKKAGE